MDRNQLIGFVLIFFILIGWSIMTAPTPEEIEAAKQEEKIALQERQKADDAPAVSSFDQPTAPTNPTSNTTIGEPANSQFGIFSEAAQGREEKVLLSNNLMNLSLSSKGGRINYTELKEHFKLLSAPGEEESKIPVRLFEDDKNKYNYQIELTDRNINTEDLYFTTEQSGNTVTFRATATNGGYIQQKYELVDDSYKIDYSVEVVGLGNMLRNDQSVKLQIDNYLDHIEQNVNFEKMYSTLYFKENDEDSENCDCRGDDEESSEQNIEWFSFVNQFFNTSLVAKDAKFDGLDVEIVSLDDGSEDMKRISTLTTLPLDGRSSSKFDMTIFSGPNEYKDLKVFDADLEEIIPFGNSIFGDINRHFIRPFFDWLSQFVGSKGIVIILLIFIIKMAVYPLTYKMLHSQAKMGALKPQIAGLKDKFKGDAQKTQMETMKIYREYGVSPLGGCFPMIAQIPIWYALFRFFPASITFRQESFLWAHDLSSYDVMFNLPFTIPVIGAHLSLFTVLYAISQVIYTYYNSKHMDMSANPAMKYVQYMMPLMFFGFFNSYASGLTCYMLFSNLFTIAQTIITKKFVFNDEKILAELNIKKAKPKKKGGFQQKLAEAMERQQKIQAKRDAQKNKKK